MVRRVEVLGCRVDALRQLGGIRQRRVLRALERVVTQSENEPFPEALTALDDVYASPSRLDPLWYKHG